MASNRCLDIPENVGGPVSCGNAERPGPHQGLRPLATPAGVGAPPSREEKKLMVALDIFASFEFDKDRDLRDSFYEQAKLQTQHRVKNCSLREAYPTEEWKREAREAIRGCNVAIVLIGEDTHNASGVRQRWT